MTTRLISEIARDIRNNWEDVYFGAVPYLQAMGNLQRIGDHYGADDARGIVLYFLSNAASFKGPDARRLKAELKGMLK